MVMLVVFVSVSPAIIAYAGVLGFLLTIPVSFLILLLMNLGLAFQFGSCEIVKVLIRNEENTRTVKKLLEKQLLVMIKTKKNKKV